MITIDYCGYHTHNPDHSLIYRPNGSDSYLFLLVLSPMIFNFQNRPAVKAAPGACILFEPGCYQHYQAAKKFYNSYVHFFCEDALIRKYQITTNALFFPSNTEEIHWLIKKIYQEFLNRLPECEELLHLYINQLLILISRTQMQTQIPNEQQQAIYPELLSIREQMLNKCEQPWNIDQLCQILHMGKSQLYKYYQQFFCSSPMDELIQARLQKACFLLSNEAITIKEAAFLSGFQNINHFNRLFRKTYGCTPREYRRKK